MLAFYSHMPALPRTSLLKMPTQRRSVETVHAILDAATRVLQTEGTIGFTTNRIAEVAGVSPGTLYQYFASGDMVLAGIVERGMLDAEDLVRAAMLSESDRPLGELVGHAMTAVAVALEPHAGLLTEIVSAAPLMARHGITGVLETRISDAIRDRLARDPTRYRPRGGAAALYVGVNGVIYVFLKWLCERPPHVPREALIATIVGMIDAIVDDAAVTPAAPKSARTKPNARARRKAHAKR